MASGRAKIRDATAASRPPCMETSWRGSLNHRCPLSGREFETSFEAASQLSCTWGCNPKEKTWFAYILMVNHVNPRFLRQTPYTCPPVHLSTCPHPPSCLLGRLGSSTSAALVLGRLPGKYIYLADRSLMRIPKGQRWCSHAIHEP